MFICLQKTNLISQSFWQILHFKESCNLIGQEHFVQYFGQNKHFARHGVCNEKSRIKRTLILHSFLEKKMKKFSKKCNVIFGFFLPKFWQKWIFHKNLAPSLFSIYSPLTSCKKLEKTNEPIQRKTLN